MSAAVVSSGAPESESSSGIRRRVRSPVAAARPADYPAIHCFLREVFGAPSRNEFNASLEDPFFEPNDRLLLRRAGQIVAHVHVTHRVMQFGALQIPISELGWLAAASHCRQQGLATHLLVAAEKHMAESGATVGMLQTRIPHFFRRTGWALCGRGAFRMAGAHAVLSRLLDRGLRSGRHHRLHVRPWRRWEEAGLARIYQQNFAGSYGPLERTRAYWQWLLRRQAFDQLYVALDGPDLWDLDETSTRLVGYAAVKGHRVVELMTTPGRRKAGMEILAHVCGDAIEQDRRSIVLHAPPGSPWFDVFDEVGGLRPDHECEPDRGEVWMARILDPPALLRSLCGEFLRRAKEARIPLPLDLGLAVDGQKYQIELRADRASVATNQTGRSYLRLNIADFTRLVLGQLDWDQAVQQGRVEPSTALAAQAACAIFPSLPLWRPPLDELCGP